MKRKILKPGAYKVTVMKFRNKKEQTTYQRAWIRYLKKKQILALELSLA